MNIYVNLRKLRHLTQKRSINVKAQCKNDDIVAGAYSVGAASNIRPNIVIKEDIQAGNGRRI